MARQTPAAYLSKIAGHQISPPEFLAELLKVWLPPEASRTGSQPTKIGVCVSGGPDSMALASLFQQLKGRDMGPRLHLTALVIDHRHRRDSQREAATVAGWLQDLGRMSYGI